jgi:Tol biopolymer transport system component/DNA-binding winged helix-turn-helix (wHTH) protein
VIPRIHRKAAATLQSQRPGSESHRIRFDAFEADLSTEELSRAGRRVRLPQQSFRVLATFLEKPGQLVTRQELRDRLWPGNAPLEYDQGLNTAVNRLREALRDSAEAPRFIETLPKRGYRFIATVEPRPAPSPRMAPVGSLETALNPPLEAATSSSHDTPPHPSGDADLYESSETAANSSQPSDSGRSQGPVPNSTPDAAARRSREPAPDPSPYDAPNAAPHPSRRKTVFAAVTALALALLIAVLFLLTTRHPTTNPTAKRRVVLFTSLPGLEIAPTFSPDGSQIAFAWNGGADAGRKFDLYVKSLGSERLLQLTHQPTKWLTPAWSPDGSSIAFIRQPEEGGPSIFVIPALGGSERTIVDSHVAVGRSVQLSWSPDSRRLAYAAYGERGAAQVFIVDLDSLKTQPLTPAPECEEAGEPAFSPDGKQLALFCMSSAAVYAIYVVDLPHGPLRRLASILGYPQGLAWAADGNHLILANDPGNGGELWQLSLSGEMTQLPFDEEASAPAVDPRGGRLAYVRGRGTIDIWRADLTAAHPDESARKLIYSTRTQTVPRYSPDGKLIAFQSNRSGSTEIWLTNADGTEPERLTSFNGPYTSGPTWCSDGRRIAFDSRASGLSAIYVEDIHERVPHKVVTTAENLSSPAWSQDCRWLFAFQSNFGSSVLYRFPSSGGPAERFADRPSNYAVVTGDRIVFNWMHPDGTTLLTKPVNGGRESALENMPRLAYADSWVANASGIYYTDLLTKPITVNFYDFVTHTTSTVMTLSQPPTPSGPGLNLSPDGHWLLYSQIENEQSEIILAPAP